MFGGYSKTGGVNVARRNDPETLTQLRKELDNMEKRNSAISIDPGEMVETRVLDQDGQSRILSRVIVNDIPPEAETCDGRLPVRLDGVPVPPVVLEGAYLRYLRRMAGMKNEEVGRMVGVTSSAISNWENGVTRVPADTWDELIELLTVT